MNNVIAETAGRMSRRTPSRASKSGTKIMKQRVTLRLPEPLYDRLEALQDITHASSVTEVLKNALLFYDALVEERLKGNDVYVISDDGVKTKYPVFL